jgi:hypothetical protein
MGAGVARRVQFEILFRCEPERVDVGDGEDVACGTQEKMSWEVWGRHCRCCMAGVWSWELFDCSNTHAVSE